MIPLDLVIALTPALLVACLWLKDVLARRLGEVRIVQELPGGR